MGSKIQVLPSNVMLPVVALHQMNHLLQSGQMHEDELSQFAVIVEENDRNNVMRVLRLMVLLVIAPVLVQPMRQPVVMVSKMLENSVMMDLRMIVDLESVLQVVLAYGERYRADILSEIRFLLNSRRFPLDCVVE